MDIETKIYVDQKIRDSGQIFKLENIFGQIRTVDTAPSHTPRNLFEQFIIYTNGATLRFYLYDTTNNAWRYVALT